MVRKRKSAGPAIATRPMNEPLVLGLDLGTGGVRAIAATADGRLLAQSAVAYESLPPESTDRHEQSPQLWWESVARCLHKLTDELKRKGCDFGRLQAVAVDGTSGTIVAIDAAGKAVRPAIMYNDPRWP